MTSATKVPGRYNDGASARTRAVEISFGETELTLVGDGPTETIPYADLVLIDGAEGDEVRLSRKSIADARLIVPESARALFTAHAPQILSRAGERSRGLLLIGGLVGAGAALIAALFVGIPMAAEPLSRVTPKSVEVTMGDNVASQIEFMMPPCTGLRAERAMAAAQPLFAELEAAADPGFKITYQFVEMEAPNALALPGGRVMITSGLLDTLENSDELAAVVAHELAHVKNRDGMVALYRNAGLSILLEVITGGTGLATQAVLLAGQATQMRHTRGQEEEADRLAMDFMDTANRDPAALARAFKRLKTFIQEEEDGKKPGNFEIPEWLASHPDLDKRIEAAQARAKPDRAQPLSGEAWETVRQACQGRWIEEDPVDKPATEETAP
jgi:Zn-dependent protease with chaperone function